MAFPFFQMIFVSLCVARKLVGLLGLSISDGFLRHAFVVRILNQIGGLLSARNVTRICLKKGDVVLTTTL
jgi:hypothetical protein